MPRKTDPLLDSSGTLTSYQPTLGERLVDAIAGNLSGDNREGVRKADILMRGLEFTPLGAATGFYDAGREAGSGNYFGCFGIGGPGRAPRA